MKRSRSGVFFLALRVSAGILASPAAVASADEPVERPASKPIYVCPMHSDVKSVTPGKCPKCGMTLRTAREGTDLPAIPAATAPVGRVDKLRIPDAAVLDQDGRKLRFYTDLVKGRTVAINFIFTTCTTICPPLAATFRSVQRRLEARGSGHVMLISVSVDPTVDIPERLKSFAAKFHAAPGWTFVTGAQSEIDGLLMALGAAVTDKNAHTPTVLIGNDRTGDWTRAYGLAAPDKLAAIIADIAAQSPSEPPRQTPETIDRLPRR